MVKTLKIDCDWLPPLEWIKDYTALMFKIVHCAVPEVHVTKVRAIKSKHHNLHFVVTLDKHVDDMTACRLQFLLGDDRHRCRYNLARVEIGMINGEWNKLFIKSKTREVLI